MHSILTDKQEIFDFVAHHLFKQGKRAKRDGNNVGCAYRNSEGLTCAIGCLIPDHRYSRTMESAGAIFLAHKYIHEWISISNFLNSLQMVHDNEQHWMFTKTMRAALRDVANIYEINADIVDTLSFENR